MLNSYAVPGTVTNAHDTANYPRDNGNTGWDAVGKTSLGGMAISEDESRLFVINLANRTLYALNPATGASLGSQTTPTNLPLPSGTCAAGDARPFAVTWYHGSVYVGLVCSAESTATADTFTDAIPTACMTAANIISRQTGRPAARRANHSSISTATATMTQAKLLSITTETDFITSATRAVFAPTFTR